MYQFVSDLKTHTLIFRISSIWYDILVQDPSVQLMHSIITKFKCSLLSQNYSFLLGSVVA